MPQAANSNVTVDFRVDSELSHIALNIDENLWREALQNLMVNALACTPTGGKIVISALIDEAHLRSDEGTHGVLRIQVQYSGKSLSEVNPLLSASSLFS